MLTIQEMHLNSLVYVGIIGFADDSTLASSRRVNYLKAMANLDSSLSTFLMSNYQNFY